MTTRTCTDDVSGFIRTHLPVTTVASIPEIRLHRACATSGLKRLSRNGTSSPYWAYTWAGGMALARYILDHPETVSGRRVFDLGTGGGLVAIAAAIARARTVIATDIDPHALSALALNAAENGVSISALCTDLLDSQPPAADLITVGDLFYTAALARNVLAFLERCRDTGIDILIGDPRRAFLPCDRLHLIAEYAVPDFGDAPEAKSNSAVFSLTLPGSHRR